jgi:hypothetical protein
VARGWSLLTVTDRLHSGGHDSLIAAAHTDTRNKSTTAVAETSDKVLFRNIYINVKDGCLLGDKVSFRLAL